MAWRPAHACPAEARPSGRDGRRPARRGGGRRSQGRIVDVGAGVGAVGLALAQRNPLASVDLVEIDPELAALAERNAARNGLETRTRVLRLDALNPKERREAGLTESASLRRHQPAILRRPRGPRLSRRGQSARACLGRGGAGSLADWIQASLAMLAPGGRFVMIHRPDALSVILAAIGGRLGALALLPVHPTIGASAHRLLVSGVKGSKAPLAHCARAHPAWGRRPTHG